MRSIVICLCTILLTACGALPVSRLDKGVSQDLPPPSLEKIAENVWIHKSYKNVPPWGPILSQGMVVRTGVGIALVDTAWNDADTNILLRLIEAETGERPYTVFVTHAHDDKMGGMAAIDLAHIESWAYHLTNKDAPERGLMPARKNFGLSFVQGPTAAPFQTGAPENQSLVAFAPGPGHTRDNTVVYHAPSKTLFGGCLIRPGRSNNLGNTADADVKNWANAVRRVADTFPEAEIIIPSHGKPGGRALLDHTIALAEKAAADLNDDD